MLGAMTEFYLVRHGETEWSRSGQHISTTELDLTEVGVRHFPLATTTVSVLGMEKETPAILRWNMPPPGR